MGAHSRFERCLSGAVIVTAEVGVVESVYVVFAVSVMVAVVVVVVSDKAEGSAWTADTRPFHVKHWSGCKRHDC
jgi:hypothetical protein